MTNYYKLYITSSKGNTSKSKYKWSSEVRKEIRQIKDGSYIVIKRIKGNADIPVGRGYWNGKELIICDDRLDVDYRVVGANVIEYHEEEER